MNAELREAVEGLYRVLSEPDADVETLVKALRDQEAEIARLISESSQHFVRAREWAERSGQQEARAEQAEALLRDIKAWDVGSFQARKTLFALPLDIRARITAHLGGENNG
jgi:hypothetical protein